jgi:glycine/D-amino acid oxidase-like deaminating enzyme
MQLHFGNLFWPVTNPSPPTYPALSDQRVTARVVIIGGGMSGVICGYVLARSGIATVLIEKETIASGSTSANTGLLQYSNDKMLSELAKDIGEKDAVLFYRACKDAAEHLNVIAEGLVREVDFKRRGSLYYASTAEDVAALRQEFDMLIKNGFDAHWWDGAQIAERFPLRCPAAIVTSGDAEINPFQFVHAMAEDASARGLAIYEKTTMKSVEPSGNGYRIITDEGEILCEQLVYAVGYAPEQTQGRWVKAELNRSYAIATDPIPSLREWHERFLIWETARPYKYVRTTADDRIIAGGLDETVREPVSSKKELRERSDKLLAELRTMFPMLSPSIKYEWCATFGESADGLPWIGEDPDRPGQFYNLGYGGNGTIYNMLGAEIIRDRLLGIDNPVASIVRLDR